MMSKQSKISSVVKQDDSSLLNVQNSFVADVKSIIEQGKQRAYQQVSDVMIDTYWNIGRRIVEEEQQGKKRAGYGTQLIDFLSQQLAMDYGDSYSPRYLRSFRKFYTVFPDIEI